MCENASDTRSSASSSGGVRQSSRLKAHLKDWNRHLWRKASSFYPHVLATITLLIVTIQWYEQRSWRSDDLLGVEIGMDSQTIVEVLLQAAKCEGAVNPYKRNWPSLKFTTDGRLKMRYWRHIAAKDWIYWAVADDNLWEDWLWSAVELTPAGRQVLEALGGTADTVQLSCTDAVPSDVGGNTCVGWDTSFSCRLLLN